MTEWISVEDKLPEPYQWVLCISSGGVYEIKRALKKSSGVGMLSAIAGADWLDERVTHWQPLPEPPTD